MRRYTVVVEPPAAGTPRRRASYGVMVPALPGCFSQGRTLEEALTNAREAIELHLEGLAADGEEIPSDSPVLLGVVEVSDPSEDRGTDQVAIPA